MRRPKRNSAWWSYLESIGKLDAPVEELAVLKRAYRLAYLKNYKRDSRSKQKEYSLCFGKSDASRIKAQAMLHGLAETTYVKSAVLGYLDSVFVVRDKAVLDRMLQILLRVENEIVQSARKDKGAWYKADRRYEDMRSAIAQMRRQIEDAFARPPLLIDEVRKALAGNEAFRELLKTMVNDFEITGKTQR